MSLPGWHQRAQQGPQSRLEVLWAHLAEGELGHTWLGREFSPLLEKAGLGLRSPTSPLPPQDGEVREAVLSCDSDSGEEPGRICPPENFMIRFLVYFKANLLLFLDYKARSGLTNTKEKEEKKRLKSFLILPSRNHYPSQRPFFSFLFSSRNEKSRSFPS